MFNPIREVYKYDGNVTITVHHVINPSIIYGKVVLDNHFKVQMEIFFTFPEENEIMQKLMLELRSTLQKYASQWRYFIIPSTPKKVMMSFVKWRISK